mgnify:CR=1 FL=1
MSTGPISVEALIAGASADAHKAAAGAACVAAAGLAVAAAGTAVAADEIALRYVPTW